MKKVKGLETPARVLKQIQKRNKEFSAADKAGKRVLIAKDVIKLLKADKLTAATGVFIGLDDQHSTVHEELEATGLREAFLANEVQCEACGLGALMLSCTLYNNRCTCGDTILKGASIGHWIDRNYPIKNGLNKIFSRDQLKLIEQTFEGGLGYFNIDNDYIENARRFYYNHPRHKDRLLAIMQNIVQNKGEFIPKEPLPRNDPLVKAVKKARRESAFGQVEKLLHEEGKWKRKATIANTKVRGIREEIRQIAVQMARELDSIGIKGDLLKRAYERSKKQI